MRARQARLARLRQDDATVLDRLYGTAYEDVRFPAPREFGDVEAADVLRFTLGLARALFDAGARTRDIQTAVIAVTATWGMQYLEVGIGGRSVQLQYAPPGRRPTVAFLALGSEDTRDLDRLAALQRLTTRIAATRMGCDEAAPALRRLTSGGSRWPWWFGLAGGALLAAMLCLLASGTVRAACVSPLVFLVAERASWTLGRSGLPSFYVTTLRTACVMAAVITLIDAGALSGPEGASVVAANVILMLPILSVVSLTEDAIDGFPSMAAVRAVGLAAFVAALVSGILITGFLLRGADTDARHTSLTALPVVLTLVTSCIGSLGNTVFMGGGPRLVPWGMATGLLGATVKVAGTSTLHWSTPLATGLATAAMGTVAAAAAPRTGIPARAVVIPGIAGGVLPGPDLYRGMLQLLLGVPGAGGYLLTTVTAVAAIGVGTVLGTIVGAGAERQWWRYRHTASGGAGVRGVPDGSGRG
ncbi:threonine/serine exporter family protein [Streptomyces sp. NPDC059398]|uniref:threonine/serine exporter family protein n=1 Tax=Streptomyces sp. NPDC059398 TaxID=3346820 RepID=UPI0036CEFEEF